MKTWVCLLRGINVGGKNKLPMADLKKIMGQLGAQDVGTYIQSGNAVFTGIVSKGAFQDALEAGIDAAMGFRPRVMLIGGEEMLAACAAFPFPEARSDPKTGHIWFCEDTPVAPDLDLLTNLARDDERFRLDGRLFYLHAPDGIGRSKLAERIERALGVATTARNLNTVDTLCEMVTHRAG
ncbi:DUF1697 domain-containing protein [Maritimibacter dapengensis]|uniref:DUF1697 domain-containing protein n=1 Tax=Maritimibacter dapengensis TaxID=2836868 RepID=A0ABS6SZJ2_9RHOB|nr:DUF1697 domain-containing protein [Maritimibacter dapengensis]MBV7378398.1 DUF1697 domain-containing protein [Maritimibacter dapengensis]